MNRSQEELLACAVDALLSNICVLDGAGNIVAVNQAWRDFASRQGTVASDDAPVAAAVAAGIRGVPRGDIPRQHHRPDAGICRQGRLSADSCCGCKNSMQQLPKRTSSFTSPTTCLCCSRKCRIAVDLAGLTMAWVGEPNRETERIVPVASYGTGRMYPRGAAPRESRFGKIGPRSTRTSKSTPTFSHGADAARLSIGNRLPRFRCVTLKPSLPCWKDHRSQSGGRAHSGANAGPYVHGPALGHDTA